MHPKISSYYLHMHPNFKLPVLHLQNLKSNVHSMSSPEKVEELAPAECPPAPSPPNVSSQSPTTGSLGGPKDQDMADSDIKPDDLSFLVSDYIKDVGRDILRYQRSSSADAGRKREKLPESSEQLRATAPTTPTPTEVEVLFQSPLDIQMKSQEILAAAKPRPQRQFRMPVNEGAATKVKNFSLLPQLLMEKVVGFLNFRSLTQCRQVCKNWNQQISSSNVFLNKSVFVMGANLELIQLCKKTQVKWQSIKCQLLPCPEFYATRSYQQKFIVSKLIQGPKTFFTAGIDSIILDHIEVQKENLLKWLTSCTVLTKLELIACTFKKTRVSWTQETLLKIAERLQEIKVHGMALCSLVDIGKLILMFTKKLKRLEVSQKGIEPLVSEVSHLRVKTLEEDMASVISLAIERNVKSLRSVGISLETLQTEGTVAKIFHRIGRVGLNLEEFKFEVRQVKDTGYLLNISPQKADVAGTLRQLLKTSKQLQKLHIPFLLMDFSDMRDLCWDLPFSMNEMGVQLCTPMMDNKSKFEIRTRFTLKKLALYGQVVSDSEWVDFRKCIPWVTQLEIHSTGSTDLHMQAVIQNMPSLNSLTFGQVAGVSDFGITGVELKIFKKASDHLASKGIEGLSCSKLRHSGQPLSSMKKLRTFICRGDMLISDIGISNGFLLPELEVLELSGSSLQVTDTGLKQLASYCPKLKKLSLQLSRASTSPEKMQAFLSKFRFLPIRAAKIDLR